jgi:hypothetical protein
MKATPPAPAASLSSIIALVSLAFTMACRAVKAVVMPKDNRDRSLSARPRSGWSHQMASATGCERLTGALIDRLTHHVHIIEANGESYRLRDAKKRLKKRA